MIKIYGHNSSEQLSKHFNVREFRCKCGNPQHQTDASSIFYLIILLI